MCRPAHGEWPRVLLLTIAARFFRFGSIRLLRTRCLKLEGINRQSWRCDFSGIRHAVQWVAADPETGLTLLRLPPRAVRPMRQAADGPNLGSDIFIVGNPFGMGHSISRGHLAGLDRELELGNRQLGGLIQIEAPLYPGDSGAVLVNSRGDWLGLIRSGLAVPSSRTTELTSTSSSPVPVSGSPDRLSSSVGLLDAEIGRTEKDNDFGFAIPAADALWVADQLRTHGSVDRAFLGVRLEPHEAARSSAQSVDSDEGPPAAIEGAVINEVIAETPAAARSFNPVTKLLG